MLEIYRNYIFDMDGTLIDSTPTHKKAFNNAISFSNKSSEISFDYEVMKGKRTLDVMIELGFNNIEAKRLTKIKQDSYREYFRNGEVNLFNGVIDCFKLIKNKNLGLFICTGASRHSTEMILKKFDLLTYVDDFITGSDVDVAKPDPKILNTLLKKNNLVRENCLFIEDSENGKLCGARAEVDTVIVNNPQLKTSTDFNTFYDFYINLKECL